MTSRRIRGQLRGLPLAGALRTASLALRGHEVAQRAIAETKIVVTEFEVM